MSGAAVGSIIAVIITAHIAQSSTMRGQPHVVLIIQADAPCMLPYMSWAITAIHVHAASANTMSTTKGTRCSRSSAVSSSVREWRAMVQLELRIYHLARD